jgi:cytochrome c-type biogenesis protein CcsB
MNHIRPRFTLGLLLVAVASLASTPSPRARASAPVERLPVEETRSWAILADGRVKPLVTYANEAALALTGRERFDGLSSLEILWGYILASDDFRNRPYLRIDSRDLKARLGLDASQKRFSVATLMGSPQFRGLVEEALRHQQGEEALSGLEKDALDAYAKLDRAAGLIRGDALTIVPIVGENADWASPNALRNAEDPGGKAISQGFVQLANAYAEKNAHAFREAARGLTAALRDVNPDVYPSEREIDRELFYEDFNAFGKAWKLYLVSFLLILLLGFSSWSWGYLLGMLLLVAGFLCHTLGIGYRWAIAGRAPVSDMYESLVFMGWGAIALALVPEILHRKRFVALAAGLTGFLCLAFAENLPIDSAINPLVPVLAHTFWLSVHVMTIMLSYSALALTMVLGHIVLFLQLFRPGKTDLPRTLSGLLYRTLQVGLLFLAAGIIFGAVWANESWGRYWGWDPKETWSLITFFVYLAIVHARFAGWLRDFGLAASSILGFLSVVMTYYGVNFILAAGLHSYGFSEGGQIYALLYVVIEIAVISMAFLRHRSAIRPALEAGH